MGSLWYYDYLILLYKYRLFYLIEEYYVAMVNRFLSGIILGINIATVSPFIKAVSPTAILGKTVKIV